VVKRVVTEVPKQLSLSLENSPTRGAALATAKSATVVRFVDAQTMSVRRQAIERVAKSGIFSVQTPHK